MRKRELEEQLRLRDREIEHIRHHYLGVEQLLTDIGAIFPSLVNEHWTGFWYADRQKPQVIDKLKQKDIHTVAQHYRDIQKQHDQECRIDDAMANIGL